MSDAPRSHADAVAGHGRDLQKVSEQLKSLVASLRVEKERLEAGPRHAGSAPIAEPAAEDAPAPDAARLSAQLALVHEAVALANAERERLRTRLSEIEAENQRICDEYVAVQERSTEITQLFVALDRIHGGLSRSETLAALQEIVINVVGSEELAIFERRGDALLLAQSFGVDANALRRIRLGQGAIGRAAATGQLYLAGRAEPPEPGEEDLSAVVPLRAGDEIAGAIAIFRLLAHKPGLAESDEALFGLLSTHAGLALHLRRARERLVVG